ncbi:MAG: hypothetical protein ACFFCQ_03680 [Promethearchaeota archaeon]
MVRELLSTKIAKKIRPHLTSEFSEGKKDPDDFYQLVDNLAVSQDLTSKEVSYIKKNPRQIYLALGLFYMLPEIFKEQNTLIVFCQLSSTLAERLVREHKYQNHQNAAKYLSKIVMDHSRASLIKSYDSRTVLEELISKITDLDTAEEMANAIIASRDTFAEIGSWSRLLYEMELLARRLRAGSIQDLTEVKQEIEKWEKRVSAINE